MKKRIANNCDITKDVEMESIALSKGLKIIAIRGSFACICECLHSFEQQLREQFPTIPTRIEMDFEIALFFNVGNSALCFDLTHRLPNVDNRPVAL
jgi:hypothetical protein